MVTVNGLSQPMRFALSAASTEDYYRSDKGTFYPHDHYAGRTKPVDYRTVRVLQSKGLVEVRLGRLLLTDAGREAWREANRALRAAEKKEGV